ncbi:MAG: hypothetical protein R3C09_25890 [Pirellulaceae bacterium]|jgi:hypothetical protein
MLMCNSVSTISLRLRLAAVGLVLALLWPQVADAQVSLATFAVDITIPVGHRCMGILPTKVRQIDDPLQAVGMVLLGPDEPVVVVALDWCEVRNAAYDLWRDELAKAASTTRQRVLVCSLHQHDAPVTDNRAQELLDEVGLPGELFDVDFQAACIADTAAAIKAAIAQAQPVTHVGIGQGQVEKVASNRRVEYADGSVRFDRQSRSGADSLLAKLDAGEIDPWLKSISFFNGEQELAVLSCYATHPMSSYGQGAVSADFIGQARRRRQVDTPGALQIYLTGCSGDVTAGKYNDGSLAARGLLADRLYQAMIVAAEQTVRYETDGWTFRCAELTLPFHDGAEFTREAMSKVLHDPQAKIDQRILAAMGLSSLERVERGQPIDVPCLDLGVAQLVVLPGEAFVGYQLMAQRLRPKSFVMVSGYGECWTGYIPTQSAMVDGFDHGWRWVGPNCEALVEQALEKVLEATK